MIMCIIMSMRMGTHIPMAMPALQAHMPWELRSC